MSYPSPHVCRMEKFFIFGKVITYEDFLKLELRVGKVVDAASVEGSQKLIKLSVDFGKEQRTVLAGLAQYLKPEGFKDNKYIFVYNLEPKKMMGLESQGMILAAGCGDTQKPIEAPEGAMEGDTIK